MKRIFDIIFALFFLIITFPVLIIVSILIKIDTKGPIFFISTRVGINNNNFKMIKFRTMYENVELVETNKLKNPDLKITRTGKFLRKYSIDEFPQFLSVIIGKMSIVGPRPALISQFKLISDRKKLGINKLMPGITGQAQINGRDKITADEKTKYDKEYLDKKCFFFDMIIILKTIKIVFNRSGITH